jgi:hypothetical protein
MVLTMPVVYVGIFVCEVCSKTSTVTDEILPYSDPIIAPPNDEEWNYVKMNGKELLCCPECYKRLKSKEQK